jgi:hypothetical protein
MKSKFILSAIPLLLLGLPNVRAQSIGPSVINVTGGSSTSSGNTFEWSVGESVVATSMSTYLIVTHGVLQPIEPATTEIAGTAVLPGLSVFPNPSSTIVNIQFDATRAGTLQYRLVDVLGKVLLENTSEVKPGTVNRQIDVKQFACATYMLHASFKSNGAAEETTTYKIQKIN